MENQSFALTFYDAEMWLMQQQVAMTMTPAISATLGLADR